MNHYSEGDSAWEAGMEFPSLHMGGSGVGGEGEGGRHGRGGITPS